MARDLIGLALVGAGTVGLLGALYGLSPALALFLAGLALVAGGGAAVYSPRPLPPARLWCGYTALGLGLATLTVLGVLLAPWAGVFAVLTAAGVWLSGEEA